MRYSRQKVSRYAYPILVALVVLIGLSLIVQSVSAFVSDPVQSAWKRVRAAGSYHFSADVIQITSPRPSPAMVGQTNNRQELHVEGATDLNARTMEMKLWGQGGNITQDSQSLEVQVANGKTRVRRAMHAWEDVGDFTSSFAPANDFTSFLSGLKNVKAEGSETRAGVTFTRYSFEIDGPAYARYLKEWQEQELNRTGKLPPGINLSAPKAFAEMQGTGEVLINDRGLPIHQTIWMTFPDQEHGKISSEMKVQFSQYGEISPLWAINSATVQQWAHSLAPFTGTLIVISLAVMSMVMLMTFRQSRRLRSFLSMMFTIVLVITPLLRDFKVASFGEEQKAYAAESGQGSSDMQRTIQELATQQRRTPEEELATVVTNVKMSQQFGDSGVDSDQDGLTDQQEAIFGTNLHLPDSDGDGKTDYQQFVLVDERVRQNTLDMPLLFDTQNPDGDSDKDGLTDGQEAVLGTNPLSTDSDGDGLSDFDEITRPISTAKGTRYLDPLNEDSNKDGLGDGMECPAIPTCTDTNGDGMPDVFERDNDSDGVPDRLDISPHTASTSGVVNQVFTGQKPLQLILSNLKPNNTTFVEFQIRPTNVNHLWYAFNVLDWPMGDRQGNIQDADGKTFYDLNPDLSAHPNSYGDMKLVPALQITINDTPDNLPNQADLDSFRINVNRSGSETTVYVPMQLVTDEQTGARVAFSARMPYMPDARGWGKAHNVRLVWMVQMLVDKCKEGAYKNNQCTDYIYNESSVIQTYNDEWHLTGLSVREDHGVDAAIAYEDPAVDDNIKDDLALWMLADNLSNVFLSGRPDITVAEIQRRFNRLTNSGVTEEQRWAVPNKIHVSSFPTYKHIDAYSVDMMGVQSLKILHERFASYGKQDANFYPTLMYITTQRYRHMNMDNLIRGGRNTTYNSGVLSVDLTEQGGNGKDAVFEQTMNSVSWSPYRYKGEQWESCSKDVYWDELGRRYPTDKLGDLASDVTSQRGYQALTQIFYMALVQGLSNVVKIGDKFITFDPVKLSDNAMYKKVSSIVTGIVNISLKVTAFVNRTILDKLGAIPTTGGVVGLVSSLVKGLGILFDGLAKVNALNSMGKALHAVLKTLEAITSFFKSKAGIAIIVVVVLVVIAIIIAAIITVVVGYMLGWFNSIIAYYNNNEWLQTTVKVLMAVIAIFTSIVLPILSLIWTIANIIANVIMGISLVAAVQSAGISIAIGYVITMLINMIVSIVTAGIALGFFIYAIASGQVKTATEMRSLSATTFAIIAVTFIYLFIMMQGLVFGFILGAVDAILQYIFGVETIRERLQKWIADSLHGVDVLAEIKDVSNDASRTEITLLQPSLGMREGNIATFRMGFTVTTRSVEAKTKLGREYNPGLDLYIAARTNFLFSFRAITEQLNLLSSSSTNGWQNMAWATWKKQSPDLSTYTTLKPGINARPFSSVRLYTSFALPGRECMLADTSSFGGFFSSLWNYFTKGKPTCIDFVARSTSDDNAKEEQKRPNPVGSTIVLDILPDTLDKFYALDWGNNGITLPPPLNNLSGNMTFPLKKDGDGDGLPSASDVNDATWDSDGDGLSDAYEVNRRSLPSNRGGAAFDPLKYDTDNDGINDMEESFLGTNPALADTDNDGLTDAQEIQGWRFTYQNITTLIRSDPTRADADGDGMNDLTEKVLYEMSPTKYVFNPNVQNPNPIAISTSFSDQDGILGRGQTATYNVSIQNTLKDNAGIRGSLTQNIPAVLGGHSQSKNFLLSPDQSLALNANLSVASNANSQEVKITNNVQSALNIPTSWQWQSNPNYWNSGIWRPVQIAMTAVNFWDVPFLVANAEDNSQLVTWRMAMDGSLSGRQLFGYVDTSAPGNGITCTQDGACIVAWRSNTGAITTRVWSPAWVSEPVTVGSGFVPRVATDGTTFMVLWRNGQSINIQRVSRAASLQGGTQVLDAQAAGDTTTDITWAGSHYLATWTSSNGNLQFQPIEANGTLGTRFNLGTATDSTLSYDPISNRVLVVWKYYSALGGCVYDPATRTLMLDTTSFHLGYSSYAYPQETFYRPTIANDPVHGGWVVSWSVKSVWNNWWWWWSNSYQSSTYYQAIDSNGKIRSYQQRNGWEFFPVVYGNVRDFLQSAIACTNQNNTLSDRTNTTCILRSTSLIPANDWMRAEPVALQGTFNAKIQQDSATTIQIDATPPSSRVTSIKNGQFVRDTQGLVFQGEALDTNGISLVEYSLDGGAWQSASGTSIWNGTLPNMQLPEGPHTIRTRAKDIVDNQETPGIGTSFVVDLVPPWVVIDTNVVRVSENQGQRVVRLSGTVSDPAGIKAVDILLNKQEGTDGNGWQSARVQGGTWDIDYVVSSVGTSSVYEVTARAIDTVDNQTAPANYIKKTVQVDHESPIADIDVSQIPNSVISKQTPTLRGMMVDPGAVSSGLTSPEVAFQSLDEEITGQYSPVTWYPASWSAAPDLGQWTQLSFEEGAGATTFADSSGKGNSATCSGAGCPSMQQSGRHGSAIAFNGSNTLLRLTNNVNLANQSFSVGFWAKRNRINERDYILWSNSTAINHGLLVGFREGNTFTCAFWGNDLDTPAYTDTDWHHWVCTYDATSRLRRIYRDGELVAQDIATANYQGSGNLTLGQTSFSAYQGLLDEFTLFNRALTTAEVRTLQSNTLRSTTQRKTWSLTVPDGLEGFYAIYVRGTDGVGNRTEDRKRLEVWRGEIDTRPPRLSYRYSTIWGGYVTCMLDDLNAVETYPQTWCIIRHSWWGWYSTMLFAEKRSYYSSPWWNAWSQGKQRLSRVEFQPTYPMWWMQPYMEGYSCDSYGNCQYNVQHWPSGMSAMVATAAIAAPLQTAIITPNVTLTISETQPLTITAIGIGDKPIAKMRLLVNGTETTIADYLKDTIYMPYSNTQRVRWTTHWTPPSDGRYILHVLAEDVDGLKLTVAETNPVTVTVDGKPPTIDIPLTKFTMQQQPDQDVGGFIRIPITASDNVGLSRVQLLQGDVWTDAITQSVTLPNGTTVPWSAVWNADESFPDGKSYDISVRAIDDAALTTRITRTITVDLKPPEVVTVTLTARDKQGSVQPITPGMTVRTSDPTLTMDWTASNDNSGIATYHAGWTTSSTPTMSSLTSYTPQQQRHEQRGFPEASISYAHLIITDGNGNTQQQTYGPIYIDSPTTPDIITTPVVTATLASLSSPEQAAERVALGIVPDYDGWLSSGCSQVGIDRSFSRKALGMQTLTDTQRLNMTWDRQAMRFAWSGTNPDSDGDVFIYLDTTPGGATRVFNPYASMVITPTTVIQPPIAAQPFKTFLPFIAKTSTAEREELGTGQAPHPSTSETTGRPRTYTLRPTSNGNVEAVTPWENTTHLAATTTITDGKLPQVGLPASFEADYVLWITNTKTMELRRWDGATWGSVGTYAAPLMTYDTTAKRTEATIAMNTLGINDPSKTAVKVLALASDKDVLNLWAAIPSPNPLNSPRIINPATADLINSTPFTLTRFVQLESLGEGVCPTQGRFSGADLRATLQVDQAGIQYSFLNDGLFFLSNQLFVNTQAFETKFLSFIDTNRPPVALNQKLTYTMHYTNTGQGVAPDAFIAVILYHPLRVETGDYDIRTLDDSTVLTFRLGDVEPGASGTRTFSAIVDPNRDSASRPRASVDMLLYDAIEWGHTIPMPYEWLWSDHEIDRVGTSGLAITAPQNSIKPGEVTLKGTVKDAFGVSKINVEVKDPAGSTNTISCADAVPSDDTWSCPITISNAQNDATYQVRVQASNTAGMISDWTAWKPLIVDTIPPTVTLEEQGALFSNNGIIGSGNAKITIAVQDNREVAGVDICTESCNQLSLPSGTTATWIYHLAVPEEVDGVVQNVQFFGIDRVGHRSTVPLSVTYLADNVAPTLTVAQKLQTVSLQQIKAGTAVISGTWKDGSGIRTMYAQVMPFDGASFSELISRDGKDSWSYTPLGITSAGTYAIQVEATDNAGNVSRIEPFELVVTP